MSVVTLVEKFGSDLTIANAARVSFGKKVEKFQAAEQRLLNYLARHQHWSPFRHVFLQLHIQCPEFVARQLYKHIVGISVTAGHPTVDHAWNEISGRYVELADVYFQPEKSWRTKPESAKQGSGGLHASEQVQLKADLVYQEAVSRSVLDQFMTVRCRRLPSLIQNSIRCLSAYRYMLSEGIAPEQARMVLPMSFMTEFYWTASFEAVMNVVRLRTAPDAQEEIRNLARQIQDIVIAAFPGASEAVMGFNSLPSMGGSLLCQVPQSQ